MGGDEGYGWVQPMNSENAFVHFYPHPVDGLSPRAVYDRRQYGEAYAGYDPLFFSKRLDRGLINYALAPKQRKLVSLNTHTGHPRWGDFYTKPTHGAKPSHAFPNPPLLQAQRFNRWQKVQP